MGEKKKRSDSAEAVVGVEVTEVAAMVCAQGKMCIANHPREIPHSLVHWGHSPGSSFLPLSLTQLQQGLWGWFRPWLTPLAEQQKFQPLLVVDVLVLSCQCTSKV